MHKGVTNSSSYITACTEVTPTSGPLGMVDETILDNQITASSVYGMYQPWHGRLQNTKCWAANREDQNQWIEVDFLKVVTVTGIQTQGSGSSGEWIKKLNIAYKDADDADWSYIMKHPDDPDNVDRKVTRHTISTVILHICYIYSFLLHLYNHLFILIAFVILLSTVKKVNISQVKKQCNFDISTHQLVDFKLRLLIFLFCLKKFDKFSPNTIG